MSDNRSKIIAGLAGVAGVLLAFFGVRALMRWMQQRSHDETYQARARQRLRSAETYDVDKMERMPQGTRYQQQDQPDRQPIPTTGIGEAEMLEMDVTGNPQVETSDQTSALAQALISFREMIDQLRVRRAEAGSDTGNGDLRSLTPTDRDHFREAADDLSYLLEGYAAGNVENDPLQSSIYRLTVKVRDAMQNPDYTDADLFRINGEVRTEACRLAAEMPTNADMEQVVELYECS